MHTKWSSLINLWSIWTVIISMMTYPNCQIMNCHWLGKYSYCLKLHNLTSWLNYKFTFNHNNCQLQYLNDFCIKFVQFINIGSILCSMVYAYAIYLLYISVFSLIICIVCVTILTVIVLLESFLILLSMYISFINCGLIIYIIIYICVTCCIDGIYPSPSPTHT